MTTAKKFACILFSGTKQDKEINKNLSVFSIDKENVFYYNGLQKRRNIIHAV